MNGFAQGFWHAPHAAYVQAAYAISAVVLAVAVGSSLLRARRWRRRAERGRR